MSVIKKYKAIIIVTTLLAVGTIGWLIPTIDHEVQVYNDFESHYSKLNLAASREVELYICKPKGMGPFPGVVFHTGSGAEKALYKEYAKAFAQEGFATVIKGPATGGTTGLSEDEGWNRSTKDTIEVLRYFQRQEYIDSHKLIIAGHSAGANLAYRVGVALPDEIAGVIAIAGRFPPTVESFPTNLLLATGVNDSLVPPEKLQEVAKQFYNMQLKQDHIYGSFGEGTAAKLYVSPESGHLTEAWDRNIIYEASKWASQCLGDNFQGSYVIKPMSFTKLGWRLLGGLLFIAAITVLINKSALDKEQKLQKSLRIFGSFFMLYLILSSTLSSSFIDLGPFKYNIERHLLAGFSVLITLFIICRLKLESFLFKTVGLLVASLLIFIALLSDMFSSFPAFVAGGSIIIFKSIMVFILTLLISVILHLSDYHPTETLVVVGLVLIWLLPIVVFPML